MVYTCTTSKCTAFTSHGFKFNLALHKMLHDFVYVQLSILVPALQEALVQCWSLPKPSLCSTTYLLELPLSSSA